MVLMQISAALIFMIYFAFPQTAADDQIGKQSYLSVLSCPAATKCVSTMMRVSHRPAETDRQMWAVRQVGQASLKSGIRQFQCTSKIQADEVIHCETDRKPPVLGEKKNTR